MLGLHLEGRVGSLRVSAHQVNVRRRTRCATARRITRLGSHAAWARRPGVVQSGLSYSAGDEGIGRGAGTEPRPPPRLDDGTARRPMAMRPGGTRREMDRGPDRDPRETRGGRRHAFRSPGAARAGLAGEGQAGQRGVRAPRGGLAMTDDGRGSRTNSAGGRHGDRPELLVELLALEVELRRSQGERPTPEEYLARFPEQDAAIAAAFDAPAGRRRMRRATRRGPITRSVDPEGQEPTIAPRPGRGLRRPDGPGSARTSATSSCWRRSRGAGWASSTRPTSGASTASSP